MRLDLLLALRRLRADRFVNTIAILVASVAIGLAAAVAGGVHRVAVAPLDYPDSRRLIRIVGVSAGVAGETNVSPPDFRDMRRRLRGVDSLAAVSPFAPQLTHTGSGVPQLVTARLITAGYFRTLRLPVVGREFTEREETPPARVVIVGERWWKTRLGARPDAVGTTITLNGLGYEVVGIVPDREQVFDTPDVWLPMQLPSEQIRALRVAAVIGRMQAGSSMASIVAEVDSLGESLRREHPATSGNWRPVVVPLAESISGPARPAARLMMVLVCVLWLATVVAIGGLALAKAAAAATERAVRVALGATRARLLRAVLVEQAVGGAAMLCGGVVTGFWAQEALQRLGILRPSDTTDPLVVAATALALVFITVAVSAAASASVTIRPAMLVARASVTRSSHRRGHLVLAVQLALSIALLSLGVAVASGALALHRVGLGFDPSGAHYFRIVLPPRYATPDARAAFWRQLVEQSNRIPGVAGAVLTTELPFTGQANPTAFRVKDADGRESDTDIRSVSPDFFRTVGMRLIAGNYPSESDTPASPKVVLINERLRRGLFGQASGIGQSLEFNFTSPPYRAEIIGIVSDVLHAGPAGGPKAEAYFPVNQSPLPAYTLVVRATLPPDTIQAALASVVGRMDQEVAVPHPTVWIDAVAQRFRVYLWRATVSLAVAAIVLLLATVGAYATASHVATTRRREFTLRLALGATPESIRGLLVGAGVRIFAVAACAGGVTGYAAVRLAGSVLEGTGNHPVLACAVAMSVALGALVLAGWRPARQASRLDTAAILRD